MTSKTSSVSKSKSISKKKGSGAPASCGGSKSPENRVQQKKTRLENLMRIRKDSLIPDKKGGLIFNVIKCPKPLP